MKVLFHGLALMCLVAGLTLDVCASNTELKPKAEYGCAGVNQHYRQRNCERVRERAEIFAGKWPAEIKQQWVQLITSRTDDACTSVDLIERSFLPTFYPASSAVRKQRFEVLDTQLTLLFADLLLKPRIRAIVEELSEKNVLPHNRHRQRAKQFCHESRRLEELLAQRQTVTATQVDTQIKGPVDVSAQDLKGPEPSDETPRLIAIFVGKQGERCCYISPVDDLLKQGDPFQTGQIQTISDERVTYTQAGQSYSLTLDL